MHRSELGRNEIEERDRGTRLLFGAYCVPTVGSKYRLQYNDQRTNVCSTNVGTTVLLSTHIITNAGRRWGSEVQIGMVDHVADHVLRTVHVRGPRNPWQHFAAPLDTGAQTGGGQGREKRFLDPMRDGHIYPLGHPSC